MIDFAQLFPGGVGAAVGATVATLATLWRTRQRDAAEVAVIVAADLRSTLAAQGAELVAAQERHRTALGELDARIDLLEAERDECRKALAAVSARVKDLENGHG